ncbi:hypothetical protein PG993_003124 [Apiospora rasikravindrae]|uniref:Heterokaryon incompatibility domain-containing protein n=1 Tax=Apiospora rasikravindrae TaxID=990691 RepID=A0ABR1U1D4_9PEZI
MSSGIKFHRNPCSLSRQDLREWPRRLLHVPSMCSHERCPGNIYDGIQEPTYNTFSYTWGRFEVARGVQIEGKRLVLPVSNITWPIPEIKSDIFTVDELWNAVKASATNDWLWIDVACIDQKDEKVRDDEIGRQAAIFNNAAASYIWLHSMPFDKLQRLVNLLFEAKARADDCLVARSAKSYYDSEDDQQFPQSPGEQESCIDSRDWLDKVSETISILEADPWFSSLWTLQEAYLRQDSIILSKDARMPQRKESENDVERVYETVGLASLWTAWGAIDSIIRAETSDIRSTLASSPPHLLREADQLASRIRRLGLKAGDNPVVLYSAAGYRQTRDEEDRIYGIMQVFGLRLGKARDPGVHFTLEELEMQFATALNARSTVWAQLFVHTEPQRAGYHWCISQSSHLPDCLTLIVLATRSSSTVAIDQGNNEALFSGKGCTFGMLKNAWDRAKVEKPLRANFWRTMHQEGGTVPIEVIALDNSRFAKEHISPDLRDLEQHDELHQRNQALGTLLVSNFGHALEVFLLGQISGDLDTHDSGDEFEEGEGKDYMQKDDNEEEDDETKEAFTEDPSHMASVGLLVRPVIHNGYQRWQRIGIVIWAHLPDSAMEQIDWHTVQAVLD